MEAGSNAFDFSSKMEAIEAIDGLESTSDFSPPAVDLKNNLSIFHDISRNQCDQQI